MTEERKYMIKLTLHPKNKGHVNLRSICRKVEEIPNSKLCVCTRTKDFVCMEYNSPDAETATLKIKHKGDISTILYREDINCDFLREVKNAVGVLKKIRIPELSPGNLKGDVIDISFYRPGGISENAIRRKAHELGKKMFECYIISKDGRKNGIYYGFRIQEKFRSIEDRIKELGK